MNKGNIKRVYQLWGLNYYTGEELRVYTYNSRSSAYRARKAMAEVDPYLYDYKVRTVTTKENTRQQKEEVPIEKAMQKMKAECHKFIDENIESMCKRFKELVNGSEFEKQAKDMFKKGQIEYTCEVVSCPEDLSYIESVLAFVNPSLEPGTYDFGFKLKLKQHKMANDAGECFYMLTCGKTFIGVRVFLDSIMTQKLIAWHLKELLTRKIFRKIDS